MLNLLKQPLKKLFIISIALTVIIFWYDQYIYYFNDGYTIWEDEYQYTEEYLDVLPCPADSNVAVIRIYGDIVSYGQYLDPDFVPDITSSEEVVNSINQAEQNNNIEAIIVAIDSAGGEPVASEEIANALIVADKLTIAVIRQRGLSGAYLAATGADIIFASKISDVGGIGVTMSYLDYSQKNKSEGIIYQQLSLGKFKDTGDPDKPLTAEEKQLLMRDINKINQIIIEQIANNRDLDIELVKELADGSSMLGIDAIEVGLVDKIGGLEDARKYFLDEFGMTSELCFY